MKGNERYEQYDLIRCVAMFFVLGVHSSPTLFPEESLGAEVMHSILFACNGLFFMLSGRFALSKKLDGPKDILSFYWRRFASLLPAFFVFSFVSYYVDFILDDGPFDYIMWIKASFRGILKDLSGGYLWFVFYLVGLTLVAPFLGRMLQALSDMELRLLVMICMIWAVLVVYLGKGTGYGFGYSQFIFYGWPFYYILGYCESRIGDSISSKLWLVATPLALIVNILLAYYGGAHLASNAHDLAPIYTIYIVGLYMILRNAPAWRMPIWIRSAVAYIASCSYYVYLSHRVPKKLIKWDEELMGRVPANLMSFVSMAVISLMIAAVCKIVFGAVTRFLVTRDPFREKMKKS